MKNRLATENSEVTLREIKHAGISTALAVNGMVLLENRGVLPFPHSVRTVALYGAGARHTHIGGTGSGEVNVRSFVSVESGLERAGFTIATKQWLDVFDRNLSDTEAAYRGQIQQIAREKGPLPALLVKMGTPFLPPAFPALQAGDLADADACVYVLSRTSGEGADRQDIPGDYRLTESERAEIVLLSRRYSRFVLLLNMGSSLDITEIHDLPGAILLIGQGGTGIGDAVAALMTGRETPSGHLAATWPRHYSDWPYADEFGNPTDVYYREGNLVGYRWFSGAGKAPLYPFGYGLSYTRFSISFSDAKLEEETVRVRFSVRNMGETTGREVVQLYAESPRRLLAFAKTETLKPQQTVTLCLSFSARQLAQYNEHCAAWILKEGSIPIAFGTNSRDLSVCLTVDVTEEIITEQCQPLFRREHVHETYDSSPATVDIPEQVPHLNLSAADVSCIRHDALESLPDHQLLKRLNRQEMATLCVGAARISLGDFSVIGNASAELPGAAGETTSALTDKGIPALTMADGPAGLRVNPVIYQRNDLYIKNPVEDPIFGLILPPEMIHTDLSGTIKKYQYCTALPVATLLAQTWDMSLLEQAGDLVGAEMEELGVSIWLAPGMNIQRNPLCGRNYEYYSEDPLLTGVCAAALTRGVQKHTGCGVCLKHFACNNQETNRNYCNSHVSEKALREIYLKPFEICVRESNPVSVMTGVNLLNGVHTANDRDLLTRALREEWGFDGVVITDWGVTTDIGDQSGQKYGRTSSSGCIKAGNDLIMPGSQRDVDRILRALDEGRLTDQDLRSCVNHILRMMERLHLIGEDTHA